MAISKFWLDILEEMAGKGRRLVTLQSLSTIKKGTDFQFSIERAVLEVSMTTNGHLKIKIRPISEKYEVWGEYPPSYDHES